MTHVSGDEVDINAEPTGQQQMTDCAHTYTTITQPKMRRIAQSTTVGLDDSIDSYTTQLEAPLTDTPDFFHRTDDANTSEEHADIARLIATCFVCSEDESENDADTPPPSAPPSPPPYGHPGNLTPPSEDSDPENNPTNRQATSAHTTTPAHHPHNTRRATTARERQPPPETAARTQAPMQTDPTHDELETIAHENVCLQHPTQMYCPIAGCPLATSPTLPATFISKEKLCAHL